MTSVERTEGDRALEEVVATLDSSYDLVVAEGFKDSKALKILVVGVKSISPLPQNVIAVVGDRCNVENMPVDSFEELDGLAKQIQDQVLDKALDVPTISLIVDGTRIPLGSFPSRALLGAVRGFLTALKNVPSSPKSVRIELNS